MILSENSHFSRGITVTIVEETELVKLAPNTFKQTNQFNGITNRLPEVMLI